MDEPEPPLLLTRRGGGDGRRWDQTYWVWGPPPNGPVGVVVEWPAEGVPETRVDVDGAAIRQAGRSGRDPVAGLRGYRQQGPG